MSSGSSVVADDGVSCSVGGGIGSIGEDVEFGWVVRCGSKSEQLVVYELDTVFAGGNCVREEMESAAERGGGSGVRVGSAMRVERLRAFCVGVKVEHHLGGVGEPRREVWELSERNFSNKIFALFDQLDHTHFVF